MSSANTWGFYGRREELAQLRQILARGRFFFAQISGRRQIGKTSLIQHALGEYREKVLYVQIPDSEEAGVLSTFADALDSFSVSLAKKPQTLAELAQAIGALIRRGYIVVLDEFQYFAKKRLAAFSSHLQRIVDGLRDDRSVSGGLLVLGSLFTEMVALLEERNAPLYGRTTDTLDLPHLDIASILEILDTHTGRDPDHLLMLWNLFEGVPKFYRDAFEHSRSRPFSSALSTTSLCKPMIASRPPRVTASSASSPPFTKSAAASPSRASSSPTASRAIGTVPAQRSTSSPSTMMTA